MRQLIGFIAGVLAGTAYWFWNKRVQPETLEKWRQAYENEQQRAARLEKLNATLDERDKKKPDDAIVRQAVRHGRQQDDTTG